MIDLILFILVLGLNILIHEYAHFYFARKANILCHEFAIGMGPALYQKKKGETVYSIRAIPLGGYVSMAGEEVSDFVKPGQNIGVNFDSNGNVKDIILNNTTKYEQIGKVVDSDLYGENNNPLFIELIVSGETIKYNVNKDAMYILSDKKQMQLSIAERSFENATLWQRFKVVFAGPLSNFVLAFLILFVLAFFIGKPNNNTEIGNSVNEHINEGDVITKVNNENVSTFDDISEVILNNQSNKVMIEINGTDSVEVDLTIIIQGLGFTNKPGVDEVIVGEVFGRQKDLQTDDKITGIILADKLEPNQDNYFEVNNWDDLLNYLSVENNTSKGKVKLKVERDGETQVVSYDNLNSNTLKKLDANYIHYQIGVSGTSSFNILYPLYYPILQVGNDMKQMLNTIGLLISPRSGVSVKDLSGPIGIFTLVSSARSQGVATFFIFFAFLSVNVGFLNLMPIPALDGGRLVFIAYEATTKKKVNKNVENTIITITFILLLMLMIFVTYQDITNIFR